MTTFVTRQFKALAVLMTALLLTAGMFTALSPANAAPTGGAAAESTPTAKIAARRVNYGAIALNVSNGWSGWSYDKATKTKAIKAAVKNCKSRARAEGASASGCKKTLWVRNGCGAVAVRVTNGAIVKVRGAIAFTKKEAKRKAKNKVGSGAKIHTWVCTTRYR